MADPGHIKPCLGAFDASMVVVSLVVGIGIFRTPALVARETGGELLFFAAWAVGGVVTLAGALTYAEIGSRLPRAGGYYKVIAECYHPRLAFMLNWSQVLMQGAGVAGVAFIGAEYLAAALRLGAGAAPGLAVALMVALLALNWLGVRAGARAQNALSLTKLLMIVGVALLALWRTSAPVPAGMPEPALGWGFVSALVAVFYTYGGYQTVMNLGGDLRDPRRSLPRAVVGGMLVVVAVYLLSNAAYVRVLGLPGVAESKLVAAALMRALFGPTGETLVSLAIFLSAAGCVNATILQVPRSFYAMAQDGALPRVFLPIDPRTQVQPASLLAFGASMLLPALVLGSFEKLLAYVMFNDGLMLLAVASTVFVLRRRAAEDETQVFRLPGYPFVPLLFMAALSGVVLRLLVVETPLALAGGLVLLAGWPLHALARRASAA